MRKLFLTHLAIESIYGLSIRLYFDFLIILGIFNTTLLILQLSGWITHLARDWYMIRSIQDVLFTSGFSPKLVLIWRIINIVCIIASLLLPPLYLIFTRIWLLSRRKILPDDGSVDEIQENTSISIRSKILRLIVSYSIFIFILSISIAITTGLSILQNYQFIYTLIGSSVARMIISVATSIVMVITNIIWDTINIRLTNMEKHNTHTKSRNHNMFKIILFRMLNVCIMISCKVLFSSRCILEDIGEQLLIYLILDITVYNMIEIIVPYGTYLCMKGCKSKKDHRPEFNITDEYFELVYRQFIIYIGMISFPMIVLVGAIATWIELLVDKFRLVYICKVPTYREGGNELLIAIFLMLAGLFASLSPSGGGIYTITGHYWCIGGNCTICNMFL